MYRLIVGSAVTLLLFPANTFAFDLSGAWASDRALCDRVFSKKGNAVTFAELSDLYGSGFVVTGDTIKGKTAECRIKSRKQDGNTTILSASCATSIMVADYQFSYRVIDDNTLERLIPDIDNMALKYSRCPP